MMKKQISPFKKETWNRFISEIDYRTDEPKVFRLFNSLNNKHSTKLSQPLKVTDKEVMDKMEISNKFNTFYIA